MYKKDFKNWVQRDNISVLDTLPGSNLRKGMTVSFTNDCGITFGPYEVLGFTPKPTTWGGRVYFDHSAYWFPVKPEQLTPVDPMEEAKT